CALPISVDQDGTGAADPVLAAKMGAREFQVVAQEIRQRAARLGQSFTVGTVDGQFNDLFFTRHLSSSLGDQWARCAASARARRTRLVATYVRYAALAWTSPGGSMSLTTSAAAAAMVCSSGFWWLSACSTLGERTAVGATPNSATRASEQLPAASSATVAATPTSAKSPCRRATSTNDQPVPGGSAGK